MGYRHIVISDLSIPKEEDLPKWFKERYEGVIDFSGEYWRSYSEYKRYSTLDGFEKEVQKVVRECGMRNIQLVFFADEGILRGGPDVSHVHITPDSITESNISEWTVKSL